MKTRLLFLLSLLTVPLAFASFDADANGLSDIFEFIYFQGPADPNADPDADGASNLQEQIWGTNPADSNNYPVGASAYVDSADLVLVWPVAEGKWYRIQYSDDLETWQTAAEGHVYTFREPLAASTGSLRFWRVQVFGNTPDSTGSGFDDWEQALWKRTYGKPLGESDLDGDGLPDAQEFLTAHDPMKLDHPAVGLVVFTPLEK